MHRRRRNNRYGSDRNSRDFGGHTPLYQAALHGLRCLSKLALYFAGPLLRDKYNDTALDIADTYRVSHLEEKHDDTDRKTQDVWCKLLQNIHTNELESLRTKQKSTSEELQTLTARLNDTANTTEVLRRDVAALQLSKCDSNELRQKLSELEAKLQHEQTEREKLAKIVEEEKQERQKGNDALRASISEETEARREDLRLVRSKQKNLELNVKVLQRQDAMPKGRR